MVMKLLLVSPDDLARESGVNKQIMNLARVLSSAGETVHIAGPTASKHRFGDNVHSFFALPDGSKAQRVVLESQMSALLQREAFDIVHAYEPFASPITGAAMLLAQASVATFFSRPLGTPHQKGPFWARFLARRQTPLSRSLSGLIATSRSVQADVRDALGLESLVIPVGIDFSRFHPRVSKQPPRGARDPIKVLFVGDWQKPERGFDLLHQALLRVSLQQPVELDVIGSLDNPKVVRTATFGARFLGRVSELRLPELYRHADVVVAPAINKLVSGSALLEAMACGVAVVASDVAPYQELTAGSGAVLFPAGDMDGLASALSMLGSRPDERALRGEANAMAAHAYRWDRLIGDVQEVYAAALGKRVPRARERSSSAAKLDGALKAEPEARRMFFFRAS